MTKTTAMIALYTLATMRAQTKRAGIDRRFPQVSSMYERMNPRTHYGFLSIAPNHSELLTDYRRERSRNQGFTALPTPSNTQ